jgi:hypothetical protein
MEVVRLLKTLCLPKYHPLYEPGYVMPCAGNLTEEISYANTFEILTGI